MKTRSKTITTLIAAMTLFCAAFPVWAAGGKDSGKNKGPNNVVAKYTVYNKNGELRINNRTIELLFEGGDYFLKVSSNNANPYKKYLFGCQAQNGDWYVWANNVWQVTNDSNLKTAFNSILSTTDAGDLETIINKQTGDNAIQSFGFEIDFQKVKLRKDAAAAYRSLSNNLVDENAEEKRIRIPESLPDGRVAIADGKGFSGYIVLGLFPESGSGDGLIFKRKVGLFAGEAELFNQAAYRGTDYRIKALSLLNEFFKDKGMGDTFKDTVTSFHPNYAINWGLFSNLDAATKKTLFGNLASVLGNGFRDSYRETVNGKSVFGSAKKQDVFRYLYGDRRNIYFDAYLAFCYSTARPVYAALVRDENSSQTYDPTQYEPIRETDTVHEGKELAAAAMRFYTWGVEYSLPYVFGFNNRLYEGTDRFQSLFPFANGVWSSEWLMNNDARGVNYWNSMLKNMTLLPEKKSGDSKYIEVPFNTVDAYSYQVPYANGTAGYPLPYAKKGIDSPRTFAYKLYEQMRSRYATDKKINTGTTKETLWHGYTKSASAGYKPFIPGGNDGKLNQAGVDALGLLSGSIAMTGFYDKVYDLSKTRPGVQLDGYYAMKGPGIGLDGAGKPAFSTEAPPVAWNDLRLEAEDLEKISVPVPDLSLLQLGDLVVQFGDDETSNPTRIGIVVGYTGAKPQYQSDQGAFREKVVVVTVNSDFRQVTLGTWGNPSNMFGGFTKNPDKCHVRRLLKRKAVGSDGAYPIAKWDIFDTVPEKFEVAVDGMREQTRVGGASGIKERWMPNTGEFLLLTDVKLTATNAAGVQLDLERFGGGDLEIIVNGAIDRGYDAAKSGQGNVYNNSVNSAFELALVRVTKIGTDVKKLGILRSDPDKPGAYNLIPGADSYLYGNDGKNKNGGVPAAFRKNRIWIGMDGAVVGLVNGNEEYRLGIRPVDVNSAHPGDDLLLRFALRKSGTNKALSYTLKQADGSEMLVTAEKTMKDADYVAVYDKKLLWRANLYIDEGAADWNNLHPWVTGNAWNIKPENYTGIDGGQVVSVKPFTYQSGDVTYKEVQGHVGYFSWGYDSPFHFNQKIEDQKVILGLWYVYVNNVETKLNKSINSWGGTATIQGMSLNQLYDLTFPAETWANVVSGFTALNDQQKREQLITKMTQWINGNGVYKSTVAPRKKWGNYIGTLFNNGPYSVSGSDFFPYRPKESENDNSTRGRFIGADCVGLVQRAASYSQDPYPWAVKNDLLMVTWEDTGSRNFGYPDTSTSSFITQSKELTDPKDLNPNIAELRYLVPGDVITFFDSAGATRHFAMVHNVNMNDDGSVSLSGITLIESTHKNSSPAITGAYNKLTMQTYEEYRYREDDPYGKWEAKRLKVTP